MSQIRSSTQIQCRVGVVAEEMGKSSRTRGRHPSTSPLTSLAGESPTFLSTRPLAHLSTETFLESWLI